jgi:putative transposase
MPRWPRITLPGVPHHLIQCGNNRQACFFTDDDYLFYLDWLYEYARDSGCALHAYTLMTNHVLLLLTPKTRHGAGELIKRLGQRYVQYINRTYRRSGILWEGLFRSCLTQENNYLLGCY